MVELLALANDRGSEAEFTAILGTGFAANQLPDSAVLRECFVSGPATLSGSTVILTPLTEYEALPGGKAGEAL